MNRLFNKTEMKLVSVAKYGVVVLALVFLGLSINRYLTIHRFDNAILLGLLNCVMFTIFVYKLNKLVKISNGIINVYQAKIMLVYFGRITLAPLLIYFIAEKSVSDSIILALLLCVMFAAEALFRYQYMKANSAPVNIQGNQSNDQDKII